MDDDTKYVRFLEQRIEWLLEENQVLISRLQWFGVVSPTPQALEPFQEDSMLTETAGENERGRPSKRRGSRRS